MLLVGIVGRRKSSADLSFPQTINGVSLRACINDWYKKKTEWVKSRQRTTKTEPLREMIQGLPGAGKTMVITLLIEFFVVVLGWSHGVEFACIASMNTMAALIGGSTIHSFGEVPIGDEQASLRTKTKLGQARCEHHVHEM